MALVDLSFIQYNNYFNKILRRPSPDPFNLDSYFGVETKYELHNVAFNENDGVTTYFVADKDIDDIGDYLLVYNSSTDEIFSHWFVTEAKRNRLGQCMVTLQRDLLVDFYDTIKSAPAFIERGMLSNDDPMVFNDEGLSFNQIKTYVKPLIKDGCAWIVGYLKKPTDESEGIIKDGGNITAKVSSESLVPEVEYSSWDDVPSDLRELVISNKKYIKPNYKTLYIQNIGYSNTASSCYYVNKIWATKTSYDYKYNYEVGNGFVPRANGDINLNKSTSYPLRSYNLKRKSGLTAKGTFLAFAQDIIKDSLDNSLINSTFDFENDSTLSSIDYYAGKVIKVAGTIYKIVKTENLNAVISDSLSTKQALRTSLRTGLYNSYLGFKNLLPVVNSSYQEPSNFDDLQLLFEANSTEIGLKADDQPADALLNFPASTQRQRTLDASYDIFALPFPLNDFGYSGETKMSSTDGTHTYTILQSVSMAMARELSIKFGSNLIDLQLLPYCPIDLKVTYNRPTLPSNATLECKYITVDNIIRSFIIFAANSNAQKTLYNVYEDLPIRPYSQYKEQSNLDKYRLVGGNYASMFDFNPLKSEYVYNSPFYVYCSFKPLKPFIKINPLIGKYYGQESFRDTTGLILSGDMSIDIVSNAWNEYAIQNKNFEAMFDRQIQSLDKNNQVAMDSALFSAITGTMSGAATGAIAGGMKGGVYGAVAGAVVGGVASGVGGAVDLNNQAMLLNDNKDLQKQMHSFQVDNIKALPNTIQKVSSYTVIDKVVPLLEYFTCTDVEKNYFDSYIKYNGMTVGRIGTIGEFEENGGFIQGRFIRLEGLSEDYHLANALNTTFQAGFYFEEV